MAHRELEVGDRVVSIFEEGEVIDVCECGCGYAKVKDDKGVVHGIRPNTVNIIDGD